MLWENFSREGFPRNTPAPGSYSDWAAQKNLFDGVAALTTRVYDVSSDDRPEKVEGEGVTHNLFDVLGVQPMIGRVFTAAEDQAGADRVVILSHSLWERRYGSDGNVIGREIVLNGAGFKVIGVTPPGFGFPVKKTEMWTPLGFTAKQLAVRTSHMLSVVARLKDGVSVKRANAELAVLAKRDVAMYPDANSDLEGFFAQPLRDAYTSEVHRGLIVLMAAVGCVLLIACANVANLLLSRAAGRAREFSVRAAIGAPRGRIVRQLLTESLVLSLAGSLLGVTLAVWTFSFLKNLIPEDLTATVKLSLDWRVLAFITAAALASTVLFGLVPALQASRVELTEVLKEGARGGIGGRRRMLRSTLVVAEVALSLMLLIAGTLLLRSFANIRGMNPGFRADHVLTMQLPQPMQLLVLSSGSKQDFVQRSSVFTRVLEGVRALPGVKAAGVTSALPLTWKGNNGVHYRGTGAAARIDLRCERSRDHAGLFRVDADSDQAGPGFRGRRWAERAAGGDHQ